MKQLSGETSKQRWARLKAALAASKEQPAQAFLSNLERCGNDWQGRYPCRSPACPYCRRSNTRQQKREILSAFEGCSNADLFFASISLPGCRDLADVKATIVKARRDLDNRIAAANLTGIQMKGWYEMDAVHPSQFWVLPPERYRLLCEIAPVSVGQEGPTWLPGIHAILRPGFHDVYDVRRALEAQWPIAQQVDVRPFNSARAVENNLMRVTSYSTKFSSLTALRTDRKAVYLDPWPITWDVELHSWLHGISKRTPFEFMRMSKGFQSQRVSSECGASASDPEPYPFIYSSSEIPMLYNTGSRW